MGALPIERRDRRYDVDAEVYWRGGKVETRILQVTCHGCMSALIRAGDQLEAELGVANPNVIRWEITRLELLAGAANEGEEERGEAT